MAMEPRETLGMGDSSIAVTGQFMVTLPLRPRIPKSRNTFAEEDHASDMAMESARIASPAGLTPVSLSNKLCAHVSTHVCRYLSDSDSDLCGHCQFAINNGLPCV